jgi:hypothetical protein
MDAENGEQGRGGRGAGRGVEGKQEEEGRYGQCVMLRLRLRLT